MKRLIRLLRWRGIRLGVFVMFAGPGVAWAQTNTFPSTGNVGIGTTSPSMMLHISKPGSGGATQDLQASTNDGASYARIRWVTPTQTYGIVAEPSNGLTFPNKLAIWDYNAGAARLIINNSGNVGIGTVNPASKLHVVGDAQVDGNLAAKYQDVAEWVPAATAVPPGVVVVVDPQARNQVLPASGPYDTRVAGVVSLRPGLLLGEAGESKVKVAHSGRVKVKVDASYGPIAAGDLLVTSPTSGHAMRSVPIELGGTLIHRPGTVLGKALEPLEKGQDEILVLLTLQ